MASTKTHLGIPALAALLIGATLAAAVPQAAGYEYQLYKNPENFGIVIFPKELNFEELDRHVVSLGFQPVESGTAVMRFGSKGENETYMMPLEVQNRHSIKKFIILQVLASRGILVGIFDPEWGLTLPSAIFELEEIKKRIHQTLQVFRGAQPQKETFWTPRGRPPLSGGQSPPPVFPSGFPEKPVIWFIIPKGGYVSYAGI